MESEGRCKQQALLAGAYQPQPVLRVELHKPDGKGKSKLGIPVVIDRLIQYALLQVLNPIFDSGFSDSSYGFREGRRAHHAVKEGVARLSLSWQQVYDRAKADIAASRGLTDELMASGHIATPPRELLEQAMASAPRA